MQTHKCARSARVVDKDKQARAFAQFLHTTDRHGEARALMLRHLPHYAQGFPTIKFVYMDGDKIKTSDYNGPREAKDLINFAFDKAKVRCSKRACMLMQAAVPVPGASL